MLREFERRPACGYLKPREVEDAAQDCWPGAISWLVPACVYRGPGGRLVVPDPLDAACMRETESAAQTARLEFVTSSCIPRSLLENDGAWEVTPRRLSRIVIERGVLWVDRPPAFPDGPRP